MEKVRENLKNGNTHESLCDEFQDTGPLQGNSYCSSMRGIRLEEAVSANVPPNTGSGYVGTGTTPYCG